jgi:hypothetical protein
MMSETWRPRYIARPTIETLRNMLDEMESQGWDARQQVQIKQLANMPELFIVEAVEEWVGVTA